ELQDDKSGSAFVINNMGIVSEELGNHQNAINYYNRSLKLKLDLKDKKGAASTYNNLGVVYENLQENQQALDYYQKALDIYTSLNNNKGIATLLNNIGHIYKLEKKYNKAIENYSKSLKTRTELGDAEGIASTKSYLGIIYLETNDLNKAEKFLLESYKMAQQQNSAKFLIQNSEQLASLYHAKGNNYKAYTWHKSFALLRDSLQGIEQKNKIAELETKYETEKKEHTIKTLQVENELKDAEIQKVFIVLFVFGVFGATATWLYYHQKKLQNEKNNLLLEQKLLRSQMNPHFIFNSLSLIQSFVYDNQPKSAVKYLSAFAKLIRLILENSRQEFIALDNEIETLGHYLELQKMRYMQKFDYQIIIPENLDIISYKLPPMLIQPFVENAIKHGILQKEGKGLICIEFMLENNLLCVNIEDNGIGRAKSAEINNKETDKNSSLATKITEERLLNLNRFRKQKIRFEIADLKNELGNASGTKVFVEIPLDN
ncbi:MAG: tetratricopeptide repeat protein, partial [Bacteroidales bacterium]|nr:tetratricopeptide repeat protein [Bacteroidales bacterium]